MTYVASCRQLISYGPSYSYICEYFNNYYSLSLFTALQVDNQNVRKLCIFVLCKVICIASCSSASTVSLLKCVGVHFSTNTASGIYYSSCLL